MRWCVFVTTLSRGVCLPVVAWQCCLAYSKEFERLFQYLLIVDLFITAGKET